MHGFAIRCVTTPPTRQSHIRLAECRFRRKGAGSVNRQLPGQGRYGITESPSPVTTAGDVTVVADYDKRRTAMVDTQVRPSDVTKFPIIAAMLTVPRELFVPDNLREAAYVGENLDLGGGRVLLEPRTFAKMLDALDIGPTDLVLDIGCGYGYSTAVLTRLAEFVVGVEDNADRAAEAQGLLSERGIDNAGVVEGPLVEGWRDSAPYDVILLEGGAETVPDTLTDQLKEGGRIAALFMEGGLGTVRIGYNIDGSVTWRYAFNAAAPVLAGFERQETFAF